MSDN
jgi:hypothetical protein